MHIQAAAVALARTGHDQDRATEYIAQLNESDRKQLFSFAETKLPSGNKRVLEGNYKAQFQDFATRGIYFNIQTAEVVYQDGSLSPIALVATTKYEYESPVTTPSSTFVPTCVDSSSLTGVLKASFDQYSL